MTKIPHNVFQTIIIPQKDAQKRISLNLRKISAQIKKKLRNIKHSKCKAAKKHPQTKPIKPTAHENRDGGNPPKRKHRWQRQQPRIRNSIVLPQQLLTSVVHILLSFLRPTLMMKARIHRLSSSFPLSFLAPREVRATRADPRRRPAFAGWSCRAVALRSTPVHSEGYCGSRRGEASESTIGGSGRRGSVDEMGRIVLGMEKGRAEVGGKGYSAENGSGKRGRHWLIDSGYSGGGVWRRGGHW